MGTITNRFIRVIIPIERSERSQEISELMFAPKKVQRQYKHIKAVITLFFAFKK